MPPDSGAVRLAEASDWVGLQRLIEKSPEVASEVGDYGMLPIHWACTESHVPLTLLTRLLAAYPQGARTKNDAELLPLHIAIRARVDAEWIEKLVDVYPQAVYINGPDGLSVMELADQVSLSVDALKVLRKAMDSCESPADDPASLDMRPEHDSDDDNDDRQRGLDDDSSDWHKHTSKHHLSDATTSRVSPLTLRTSHFLASDGVATPVSPAHSSSVRSVSSCGEPRDRQDSLSPRHHLVSPSSSSSSSASATTVPLLASPGVPMLPFHRKHSLDQHTHSAAAALAARQHQEMLMRARLGTGAHPHPGALASTRGRHHSLPVVPSFDHLRFTTPDHRRLGVDSVSSVCSEDGDDDDDNDGAGDNNNSVEDHSERGRPHRQLRRSSLLGLRASLGSRVRGKKAPTPAELMLQQQHPHLHSRGRGTRSFESPPEWKCDDECSICRASFGMFKHRHHCRNCGKSICSQHSADKKILMETKGFTTPQRVCVTCYAMITHKQSRDAAAVSSNEPTLDGVAISGPVAAFHQQMQQQQQQQQQQSLRRQLHHRPHLQQASRSAHSSPNSTMLSGNGSPLHGARERERERPGETWLLQSQVSELRQVVAQQQKQIESLSQSNMQLQQQLLEQEELKAETMLLITQLMTRVSTLELQQHHANDRGEERDDEEEVDDGDGIARRRTNE